VVILETPADLSAWAGKKIGTSNWFGISQDQLNRFAELTGDDQWIHIDVERASREMAGGKTLAHGFYVLSLIPFLARDIYRIEKRGRALNYGSNRVRFTSPVPAGSRVRMHQTILDVERSGNASRIRSECSFEIEGQERPALVAEFIVMVFDA